MYIVQCVPRLEPFFFCKLENQIVNDNCNAFETRAGNILRMASSTFIILRAWQHAVVVHPTWASIPLSFSPILHLLHTNVAIVHFHINSAFDAHTINISITCVSFCMTWFYIFVCRLQSSYMGRRTKRGLSLWDHVGPLLRQRKVLVWMSMTQNINPIFSAQVSKVQSGLEGSPQAVHKVH